MSVHLNNAAQALQQLLAAREPENIVTVTVRPERVDSHASFGERSVPRNRNTELHDPNLVRDRRITTAGSFHHDRGEEAA